MALNYVKYIDTFFMLRRQYTRIGQHCGIRGKRADLFSSAVRVLEMRRSEQIELLKKRGMAEEDITEEMLGFPMTWELFAERAAYHYSARSFETIIEDVIRAGVARRFYVECHKPKRKDRKEELRLVRDENGQLTLYETFEEAWNNRRDRGEIVQYFFFSPQVVNDLTAEAYHFPKPPDPERAADEQKESTLQVPPSDGVLVECPLENKSARVGNKHTEVFSCSSISQGSQNCEPPTHTPAQISQEQPGSQNSELSPLDKQKSCWNAAPNVRQGSQFCEERGAAPTKGSQNCEGKARSFARQGSQNCEGKARKTASNKEIRKESQESEKKNLISARPRAIAHAIDPLTIQQFDFSQEISPDAIRHLSRIIYAPLPARYRTEEDKERAYARIDSAAQALAAMPLVRELGLRRLAALMAYQADEASPCTWRSYCRRTYNNPHFVPRLWHMESETVLWRMSQEMQASGWWPDYLPEAPALVEQPPDIDLAALAGLAPYERVGMDLATCQAMREWLSELLTPHGYEVRAMQVGLSDARGYAIEVWYWHEDGTQRALRFYTFAEWELVVEADEHAPLGSLEFVRYLAERLRDGRVA